MYKRISAALHELQQTLRDEYSIHCNAIPYIDIDFTDQTEQLLYYGQTTKLSEGLDFDCDSYYHEPEEALVDALMEGIYLLDLDVQIIYQVRLNELLTTIYPHYKEKPYYL